MVDDWRTPAPEAVGETSLGGARAVSDMAVAVARLEDFARAAADWVWESDRQSNYTYISDGVARTVGIPAQALLGGYVFQLTYFRNIDDSIMRIVNDMQAHRPFRNILVEVSDPEGRRHQVLFCGVPAYQAGGTFAGYRGTALDVTQRVGAAGVIPEDLGRVQDVSDLAADWFWESDSEFLITDISDGYSEATGIPRSRTLGCDLRALWFGGEASDSQAGRVSNAVLPHRVMFRQRHARWRRDGTIRDFLISGKPVYDAKGQVTGYRGLGLMLEPDVGEIPVQPDAEVPHVLPEVTDADREPQTTVRAKAEQEVTPAAAPAGSVRAVFGSDATDTAQIDDSKSAASTGEEGAADFQNGQLENVKSLAMADVTEAIETCVALMQEDALKAGVDLSGPGDGLIPFLRIAPDELREILFKLIANAIEQAPPSGQVAVDAVLESSGALAIEVGVSAVSDETRLTNVMPLPMNGGLGGEGRGDAVQNLTAARSLIEQNDGVLRFVSDNEGWARAIAEFPAARVIQEHEDPDSWKILF